MVGMANGGQKNSNDSQFFITLGAFTRCVWHGGMADIRGQTERTSYMASIRSLG